MFVVKHSITDYKYMMHEVSVHHKKGFIILMYIIALVFMCMGVFIVCKRWDLRGVDTIQYTHRRTCNEERWKYITQQHCNTTNDCFKNDHRF